MAKCRDCLKESKNLDKHERCAKCSHGPKCKCADCEFERYAPRKR